jgi:uncharacterized membrane protein YhaH (DUF805 family)
MSDLTSKLATVLGPPEEREFGGDEASWSELLFGFHGRLSQRDYWILYGLTFLCMTIVGAVLGLLTIEMSKSQQQILVAVAMLPFWWPFTALTLKRMRDFGQGWSLCGFYILLGLANTFSFIADNQLVSTVLTVALLLVIIIVGSIGRVVTAK